MKRQLIAAAVTAMLVLALGSCNLPAPPPSDLSPDDAVNTAAARTVVALSTELAAGRNPTLGTLPAGQNTPAPPGDSQSGGTPGAPRPDDGPTPDPSLPCNAAEFIRDVTIPDGSTLTPGSPFTKVWEVRNAGACAWTPSYSVVFAGRGSAMGGPSTTPLLTSGEVRPGQTAQVAVPMRAPNEAGDYRGSWLLRSPEEETFGVGQDANGSIFVEIRVAEEFFFAEHICSAAWSTAEGPLPCPGQVNDPKGNVVELKDPRLEDGTQEAGLAILTVPQPVAGGYIVGRYPPVVVPADSDFRATLSCQPGANGCYVRFRITYQVDNGPEETLGEWNEGLDNNTNRVAADLDVVAGRAVTFNLYVYVNGTPEASKAIWFYPRIVKQ